MPSHESPPTRVGPYRIERQLGSGGMGAVYRALDERLGRYVALKRLHARLDSKAIRSRFFREARALASLNHPAIVQIFDLIEDAGQPWIVMELVEGRNLRQAIAGIKVSPETAMRIGRQIASGLAVAHQTGIVHRDLKAGNVIVNAAGELKILDFGLATDPWGASDSSASGEGRVMGTPAAMSPEQTYGRAVDHRSDLFSLGILLYRLIARESPFSGNDNLETVARIRTHNPPNLRQLEPEVPADLARLVERLLEKSPADRPQNADEVYRALGEILGVEEKEESPPILLAADRPGSGDQTLTALDASTVVSKSSLLATEERRLLTVLACEVTGADGTVVDPEDLAQAVHGLVRLLERSAQRYEGELGEAQGSRLTAIFGHPVTHEDDPMRAILAAYDLLRELEDASSQGDERLALRIGIHTGLAIAGRAQHDAGGLMLGQTLDLAQDLSRAATEGTILVSPTTRATAAGQAVFEAVVLANDQMAFRVEAVREPGAGEPEPKQSEVFVSRQQELRLMMDRWELVQEGEGQVLLITGEAGIGKTSLVSALRRRLGSKAVQWIQAAGSAYHTESPLRPVRQILGAIADSEQVSSSDPLARLKTLIGGAGLESEKTLPHLAHLLQLPLDQEMESKLPIDLEARRRGSLRAVVELLLGLAQAKERILVIEDLHWVDASTLELLKVLTEAVASVPLLLVLTGRSGLSVPWATQSHVNQLNLRKLTERESGELLDRILGQRQLPEELRRRIVENTDGVPLFIEEMTKSVLERMDTGASSGGSATALDIPLTLRGTLMSRLDRLGSAKEIAQVAAAQGREFDYDVVAELTGLADSELRKRIDSLAKSGLILRSRKGPGSFLFKHALIRDAAYDSLLRAQRKRAHDLIADALAKLRPELGDREPELPAHHLQQAGRYEEALGYWRSAASRAMSRSAMVEGANYLARGLDCVERLPDTPARKRTHLELVNAQGWAHSFTGGIVSEEVKESRQKAVELSRELGDTETTFGALAALYSWYYFNMEAEPCDECVRQLAELVEGSDNPEYPWMISTWRALNDYHRGELEAVIEACKPGLERWEQVDERPPDPRLLSLWKEAMPSLLSTAARLTSRSLWYLGYPERALALKAETLERSSGRSHLLSLNDYAEIELRRGDQAEARRLAEQSVDLAEEISPDAVATPYAQLGAALVYEGENERGCELLARGIEAMRATGEVWIKARILLYFVDVQLELGEIERGLEAVEEPLELSKTTLDALHEPELLRVKGELLLHKDAAKEACLCFRRAIELARRQKARSWQLRAATSLARALRRVGNTAEAIEVLEPVYSWFTEGFDTLDLKAARSLLEGLGSTAARR